MASKDIFYVGDAPEETFPWGHLGTFRIPGRESGQRFSRITVHDRLDREDHGDGKISRPVLLGEDIAKQLVKQSFDRGVFYAAGTEPAESELLEAEAHRDRYRVQLIETADSDYSRHGNPKNIPETAKRAAQAIGAVRDWLKNSLRTTACPFCKTQVHPETSVCPNCRRVVDAIKAAKIEAEQIRAVEQSSEPGVARMGNRR